MRPERIKSRGVKVGEGEPEEPGERHRDGERAQRAFPRFFRADIAPERVAAECFSEGVRRDVVQFDGEDQIKEVAVRVLRVGEESDVAEHPADVNKAQERQGDHLELALRFVPQDGNQ